MFKVLGHFLPSRGRVTAKYVFTLHHCRIRNAFPFYCKSSGLFLFKSWHIYIMGDWNENIWVVDFYSKCFLFIFQQYPQGQAECRLRNVKYFICLFFTIYSLDETEHYYVHIAKKMILQMKAENLRLIEFGKCVVTGTLRYVSFHTFYLCLSISHIVLLVDKIKSHLTYVSSPQKDPVKRRY